MGDEGQATGAQASEAAADSGRARSVTQVVTARRQLEGAGFSVRRPFPTPSLSDVDPFLLVDEMGPSDYAPGEAVGAPDHPHRGFETVTYVLEGELEHRDSAGHAGRLGPGDVQWMTAGAGVVHSEMPSAAILRDGGRVHGFQVWVNLPAADKMVPPRYQEIRGSSIPVVEPAPGARIRVVAGTAAGVVGAVTTHTPVTYLHVTLAPGARFRQPVPSAHNAMSYTFAGDGDGELAVFAPDGDTVEIVNNGQSVRELLLLTGLPLHEPVARYGPFVMSTQAEIRQAIDDFQAGRMGVIAPD